MARVNLDPRILAGEDFSPRNEKMRGDKVRRMENGKGRRKKSLRDHRKGLPAKSR